jgi:hypothetical protein
LALGKKQGTMLREKSGLVDFVPKILQFLHERLSQNPRLFRILELTIGYSNMKKPKKILQILNGT